MYLLPINALTFKVQVNYKSPVWIHCSDLNIIDLGWGFFLIHLLINLIRNPNSLMATCVYVVNKKEAEYVNS